MCLFSIINTCTQIGATWGMLYKTIIQYQLEITVATIAIQFEKQHEWNMTSKCIRRVWRYQRSYQNPYIEEEQTTPWPTEKVIKDKQRSTKHPYKTKDRVTRTPLKIRDELWCNGKNTTRKVTENRKLEQLYRKCKHFLLLAWRDTW